MPLVAHNDLPTYRLLAQAGQDVVTEGDARRRDLRELRIGLLNMMPDAALAATEQQFIGFAAASRVAANIFVYPFSLVELARSAAAEEHINTYYASFEALRTDGLDALIVTGANVANPRLEQEAFWDPLIDVVRWADSGVASILCSCLATHALVKYHYGIDRIRLPQKRWGVYGHHVSEPAHPLMRGVEARFVAPHSRYNEITREQLVDSGLTVLAESSDAGVHLAVSADGIRTVYFQGHPEYQAVSLLKEYKREVFRFIDGELDAPPPYPEHYFPDEAVRIAADYVKRCREALDRNGEVPAFPERELERLVSNTWGEAGQAIVDNWLGRVCELA